MNIKRRVGKDGKKSNKTYLKVTRKTVKVICEVFKSPRKDEMYLYVDKKEGLKRVPKELLEIFGTPKSTMTLLITEEKKLARAEGQDVLRDIREKGFYLQMPPKKDEYLLDLYKAPTEGKY